MSLEPKYSESIRFKSVLTDFFDDFVAQRGRLASPHSWGTPTNWGSRFALTTDLSMCLTKGQAFA
jgi:hypothetical protein